MKKVISVITATVICLTSFSYGSNFQQKAVAQGVEYNGTGLSVRPLINFEEAKSTLKSYGMLNADHLTLTGLHSGDSTGIVTNGQYSGYSALKINFKSAGSYSEVQIDNISSSNKSVSDWTGAQYIQFFAKNTSSNTIILDSITLKQVGYNSHLMRNGHAQQLGKESTSWSDLTLISEKDNSNYGAIPIPANFVGFIRIELSGFEDGSYTFNTSVAATGFSFWYFMSSGNGQVFYMDDIAVAGQTLASDTASQAVTVPESTYFAPFYADSEMIISTFAGGGNSTGEDALATNALLNGITGVAHDSKGNLYIAEYRNNRVKKVDTSGIITTIAGNGSSGYTGDGVAATSANLTPNAIAIDYFDNLYICDSAQARIRKVDASTGIISTVAGNGTQGNTDDGNLAAQSYINNPQGIACDVLGNLYIAEYVTNRIRKVDVNTNILTTVAGNGTMGNSGDGGQATSASLNCSFGVAVDNSGNIYIADSGNNCVKKVDTEGIITTIMRNIGFPQSLAVDSNKNVYVSDRNNHKIFKIDNSGFVSNYVGNGSLGSSGDNGSPLTAAIGDPIGLTVDGAGNLYINDIEYNRVRIVGYSESITPVKNTYYVSQNRR